MRTRFEISSTRFPRVDGAWPIALVCILCATGCASIGSGNLLARWQRPAGVVSFAGGEVACEDLRTFARDHAASPVSGAPLGSSKSDIAEAYVITRMLEAEASAAGLAADAEFQRRFRNARRDLLLEQMDASFAAGVAVSDEEMQAYYEAHQAEYNRPERIKSRVILMRLSQGASRSELRTAIEKLRQIQARFLSGTPFADLAVQYSEADNAAFGGEVPAHARGEMPESFERVAWNLERGEVSDIVRLPDGVGLILLEDRIPAMAVPYEEVALELKGRQMGDQVVKRRAAAAEEARRLFPVSVNPNVFLDTNPGYADVELARIGDESLTLAKLGLANRPPPLRESIHRALEDELMIRLAEHQATDAQRRQLAFARRHLLTETAMTHLIATASNSIEGEARATYDAEPNRFLQPERRVLEAIRFPADSGDLQTARGAAEAIARIWRPQGRLHQKNRAEVWGPIGQDALARATSAELAGTAFSIAAGDVSDPILINTGAAPTDQLEYVIFRVLEIQPPGTLPFDKVRAELMREAIAGRELDLGRAIREELLRKSRLKISPELFACDLG